MVKLLRRRRGTAGARAASYRSLLDNELEWLPAWIGGHRAAVRLARQPISRQPPPATGGDGEAGQGRRRGAIEDFTAENAERRRERIRSFSPLLSAFSAVIPLRPACISTPPSLQ